MNVMLLAAGEGTRLQPHTGITPKPAIPFMSVPLGFYSLSLLDNLNVDNLVVNTYHLPAQIENLFWKANFKAKNILFSHEVNTLMDSAGGIHLAENNLKNKGSFVIMNSDEVILPHQMGVLKDLISTHEFNKGLATILTIRHPEVGKKFGGIWVEPKSGKVNQIAKKRPAENLDGFHYVGAMVLSDRIFNYFKMPLQPENIFYDTLNSALQKGEDVYHVNIDAEWFETGNETDFLKATEVLITKLEEQTYHKASSEYWIEYLLQTICMYGGEPAIIEKVSPALAERLQKLVAKIRS